VSIFDTTTPSYEALTLQRLRIGLEQRVGAHMIESLELHQVEDVFTRSIVTRLTADVLAEKLPPERVERSSEFTWEFPASPFQHWKQKHQGAWWLRWFVARRPVRRTRHKKVATLTVDLERYRTFPQCNYVFPKDLGPYVKVAVTRDRLEWK
jgi:hypothetical protein